MPAAGVGLVLVPGAGLRSWIWERVVPRLSAPRLAVDLPGRAARPSDRATVTLESVADAIADDVEAWEPPRLVLVAHSLAGMLVPAIASRSADRVAGLVFVAAEVPAEGERPST